MLGIIGGTGLYNIRDLKIIKKELVDTPFGAPSGAMVTGELDGGKVIFLPRHGENHQCLPSEINYRANIFALKLAGVTQIISISAAGSLRSEIAPGDFSVPGQYFDMTKGIRKASFFGNGMSAHVSTAEPACPVLTEAIKNAGTKIKEPVHTGVVYACVEGPRLGTVAESNFLRNAASCDIVGMTNLPEAFLAREAQICYASIVIATDYDCWLDDPSKHVSVAKVIELYESSLGKVIHLLKLFIQELPPVKPHLCRESLKDAMITPADGLPDDQKLILAVLQR
ncbi:5'-methylthioadenosine phosphorylase [Desulfosarcina sp. BuS5]|uniref:MTAP family purine nucleoside phosphorylase n=1 Tax=Desulfosarcina sp. BuS5 TaxID=933262 RepID=UPI00048209C0|nr:MTAP family purine nucleoside phosphorylase [Desulfosarcina sp. BuS5]WDN87251.1 5'-methylthioadenosine phosphorylase [Desulfosarcina sp. BuS5]